MISWRVGNEEEKNSGNYSSDSIRNFLTSRKFKTSGERTDSWRVPETRSRRSYWKTLNNLEKNLSDKDVIKSYEIDYDETHLNASGNGIETQVFVNGNRDLKISLLISKDKDKYRVGTAVVSKEVSDYVEAEEK